MKIIKASKTEWKDIERDIVFEFPNAPDMTPQQAGQAIEKYIKEQMNLCLQERVYGKKRHTII